VLVTAPPYFAATSLGQQMKVRILVEKSLQDDEVYSCEATHEYSYHRIPRGNDTNAADCFTEELLRELDKYCCVTVVTLVYDFAPLFLDSNNGAT
jgi:hypothetical protein